MSIHKKKYEQVILYLCEQLGGSIKGKKKLAKLLYYVDFDFFEKYQTSITGASYKALPMGPFPEKLENIVSTMQKEKEIKIDNVVERDGYIPTEIYSCLGDVDVSVFSREEIGMIKRVAIKYGHLNGKQLEDLSHAEAPYIGTDLREEIPYELSYYRGTNFDDI